MKYRVDNASGEARVHISGALSFKDHQEFRQMVDEVMAMKPGKVAVDMAELASVDSAGLGLLVILNSRMKQAGATFKLCRANEAVARLLSIVQFEKLCTIEP